MSQIYSKATSSEPAIPTSFTTDKQENFAYDSGAGSAVPKNNVLQLYGDNGIETVTNDTDTDVVHIRFSQGYATTTNVQTQTLLTITLRTNTAFTINIIVNGFSDANDVAGGSLTTTLKNVAGVASIVGENDFILDSDTSLNGAKASLEASGDQVLLKVTGVAATVIQWGGCTTGWFESPQETP